MMMRPSYFQRTYFVLTLFIFFYSMPLSYAANANEASIPLKLNIPLEQIVSDLDTVVPAEMKKNNIPGLSIAIIRNAQVLWLKGYGVKNTITGEPVTPDTVFEAASFSKPIAAYYTMILEKNGLLQLDAPVHRYVKTPFLAEGGYSTAITVKHLLTHSSGLSNNLLWENTGIHFTPGERFSYSGVGFYYLQQAIESIAKQPFEEAIATELLARLHMTSSSYVYRDSYRDRIANGHSSDGNIPFLLALGFILIAIVVWLLLLPVAKRIRGENNMKSRFKLIWLLISISVFFPIAVFVVKCNMVLSFISIVMGGLFIALVFAGISLIRDHHEPLRRVIVSFLCVLAVMGLFVIVNNYFSFPSPVRQYRSSNAASTLYSTPEDIARFMIELMDPNVLPNETVAAMLTQHIRVNEIVSWGLGIGLQKIGDKKSFWHWGHQPDYQHYFVGYPEQKIGVVVMTNSTNGLDAVEKIVRIAIGGECRSPWKDIPVIFFAKK